MRQHGIKGKPGMAAVRFQHEFDHVHRASEETADDRAEEVVHEHVRDRTKADLCLFVIFKRNSIQEQRVRAPNMAQVVMVVTFLNSRDDSKSWKRGRSSFLHKKYLFADSRTTTGDNRLSICKLASSDAAGCDMCTAEIPSSCQQLPVWRAQFDAHTSTLHKLFDFQGGQP